MKKLASDRTALIEKIEGHYFRNRNAIQKRLMEFRSVQPSEYFYELLYCLLTPQSSAMHADRVVCQLRAADFRNRDLDPEPLLRKKEQYIRFHKLKSRYLKLLKNQFPGIEQKLSAGIPAPDLREWLVKNVMGLGYKEATHFLRNIGRNEGLAILDRHVLRILKNLNVIKSIPKSMSRKQYLQIEERFMEFAGNIGIVLDELDLVFWSIETGEIRK